MPLDIVSRYYPARTSNGHTEHTASSDSMPENGVWKEINEFFSLTKKRKAKGLIQEICHTQPRTTRDVVAGKFERLRALADGGLINRIEPGWDGDASCILDNNNKSILSVIFDDAGNYTVECEGVSKTYSLTTVPLTKQDYEEVWSAWEKAAPAIEKSFREDAVREMRACLDEGKRVLDLSRLRLTTLPDVLPPDITELDVSFCKLVALSQLPSGLQILKCAENKLSRMGSLPEGLKELDLSVNPWEKLPALSEGLEKLNVSGVGIRFLPVLPKTLKTLDVSDNPLTVLRGLPEGLEDLSCTNCDLTSLTLPQGLKALYADNTCCPASGNFRKG